MSLFSKRQAAPPQFTLPQDLRADLRGLFDAAPPEAAARLRSAPAESALQQLNDRLPQNEKVSAIVYCNAPFKGYGYLVLTDQRLVFALSNESRAPEVIAIPLAEISQFVFDAGIAACRYGQSKSIDVQFPGGGSYSKWVCEQVRVAANDSGPYSI